MTATPPSKGQVLSLYRNLLRASKLFHAYNYRMYVSRRARDGFRANAGIQDPLRISALFEAGSRDLEVARRQVIASGGEGGREREERQRQRE